VSFAQRLTAGIEKNLIVVVGGVIIGAFLAGISALLFIQRVVKAEIEDNWKGQMAALAKTSIEEQVKQRFGSREPALAKFFRDGLNECIRVNDVQYCWGRESKIPKWDTQATTNIVEHRFAFAAPFEGTPVVTLGIYSAKTRRFGPYSVRLAPELRFTSALRTSPKGRDPRRMFLSATWPSAHRVKTDGA